MIPYSTQDINEDDVRAVARTLRSGRLTQGPAVERFECELALCARARYAVAFNSGTAALHAAYFAAGVSYGDEVIVPAITFAATGNAALYLGARPIFADIDKFATMDVANAASKITKRTKAIVPVDYGGRPAAMREYRALARKHGLVLVADAAQSLGGQYRGKPIGSHADMTIFSFHPVKSITTGEGGAVVTNNSSYATQLRLFRTHGIAKDKTLQKRGGTWHQEMRHLGYNYRMPDINAALGTSQLKRLRGFIEKRRTAAARYEKLLRNIHGVSLPPVERTYERSAWHLYPIRVDKKKRRAVFEGLRAAGIGVQVHHIPVYLHPYYQKLGYRKHSCPQAEEFYEEEISLPLFPAITVNKQKFVAKTLARILKSL